MAYGKVAGVEKTTLYLPTDVKRALEAEGRRSKRPQAQLIREALTRYLADRPRPLPRSIGIVSDGRVTGRTAKAWLRREWDRREWIRR